MAQNGRKRPRAPHVTLERVQNSPFWWIQYRWAGTQMKRSTKMRNRADAQALARALQARLSSAYLTGVFVEEFGDSVDVVRRSTPLPHETVSLGAVVDLYKDALQAASERHRTVQTQRLDRLTLAFGGRGRAATEITTALVTSFMEKRRRDGSSDTTIHNDLVALTKAFKMATQTQPPMLKAVPYRVKIPRARLFSDKVLPESGAVEILGRLQLNEPTDRAILLALTSGLRAGDLVRLQWSDLDWDAYSVAVKTSKTGTVVSNPIPQQWMDALKPYRRPEGLICPLKHPSVEVPRRTAMLIGQKWGLHSMRKAYASALANSGHNIAVTAQLMGHRNISTTAGYITPSNDAKRKAVSAIRYLLPKEDEG